MGLEEEGRMITAISPSLLCTDVWKHVFYMSDTEAESESSICETWCKMWLSLQRQNETLRKLFSVVENATHSLHATLVRPSMRKKCNISDII